MAEVKWLSEAAKKRHIDSNGCDIYDIGCIYCKKGNEDTLEYSEVEPVESGDFEQTLTCQKCGRKWIDVYRLAEVREIVS